MKTSKQMTRYLCNNLCLKLETFTNKYKAGDKLYCSSVGERALHDNLILNQQAFSVYTVITHHMCHCLWVLNPEIKQ